MIAVLELLVLIHLLRQYRKGLKEYCMSNEQILHTQYIIIHLLPFPTKCTCINAVASQRSGRDLWSFCRRKKYDISLHQEKKGRFLNLSNRWKPSRKKSSSEEITSSRRDSDLAVAQSPSKPNFSDAEPTMSKEGKSRRTRGRR